MNKKYILFGVAAVIIAGLLWWGFHRGQSFGTVISCSTDVTCFTKLGATVSFQDDGAMILNGAVTLNAGITQTNPASVNILLGTSVFNNLVQSGAGFSLTLSTANGTTQFITAAQFCTTASVLIPQTSTTTLRIVLPAATSTLATCGASLGSFADQLIDNESSAAVTIGTTTGETARQGVQMYFASSTNQTTVGSAYPMTSTGIVIPATTTLSQRGQYTGLNVANVTLNILNTWFTRQ